ncbi:hypothetical protein [Alicyclobacillus kakegawensis]|uniref:hypothetical protein n=1 Tax=Alicyclobacillus kakegawensis TaxID=392012 RepID=UPI00082FEA0C|nr:hypothetical protein [Alicyclobacillus kakegawensis]
MEEGYIEVSSTGLRLFGPITTKHLLSLGIGLAVFAPLGVLLALFAWALPGPSYRVVVGGGIGVLPGLVMAVTPVPKRRINALTWVWRKIRFRLRPQVYRYDLEYRERRHRQEMRDWLIDIADMSRHAEGGETS